MRKISLILTKTLMFSLIMLVTVSCSKDKDDPSNPNNSVPDPKGTITANISTSTTIDFKVEGAGQINHLWWTTPNNFHIMPRLWFSQTNGGGPAIYAKVSICDLGDLNGLGNIVKIPTSGFTISRGYGDDDKSIACEEGHGYVIKEECEEIGFVRYIRLYVVESIVNTSGGIMGAKVKYQYPFEPK